MPASSESNSREKSPAKDKVKKTRKRSRSREKYKSKESKDRKRRSRSSSQDTDVFGRSVHRKRHTNERSRRDDEERAKEFERLRILYDSFNQFLKYFKKLNFKFFFF